MKKNAFLDGQKPCPITNFGLKRPNIGTGASQTKNKFPQGIYGVLLCSTFDVNIDQNFFDWIFSCGALFGLRPSLALRATFALRA